MAAAAAKAAEKEKVSAAAAEEGRRAVSGRAGGWTLRARPIDLWGGGKENECDQRQKALALSVGLSF